MLRPNSPLSPDYTAPVRYVLVYNTDVEDVPPFGVMVVSGYNTSFDAFNVRQATRNGEMSPVLVNGPSPIPAGSMGQGGFEPWPATVRYDRILSLGAEPVAGDTWGLQNGLWTLGKDIPGFTALTAGLNYLAVFARQSTSSLTVEEVDGSPSVAGVTEIKVSNGRLTDNGGGSVTITIPTDLQTLAVTLTGNQIAYDWGVYDNLHVTASPSPVFFRGLLATSTNGRRLRITNVSAANYVWLVNEDGLDSASNRIKTPDGRNYYIAPQESVDILYDTGQSRWLVVDYWVVREGYIKAWRPYKGY